MNEYQSLPALLTRREVALGACRDLLSQQGYVSLGSWLTIDESSPDDWTNLRRCCRALPNDPYVDAGDKNPRGLAQFIHYPDGTIHALSAHRLANTAIDVSPFSIDKANPRAPDTRLFAYPNLEILDNRAVHDMVRAAVAIDPVECYLAKRWPYLVQIFFQGVEVTEQRPNAQAAPPPFAHKDKCRSKVVVLIGRHNVTGGDSVILPATQLGRATHDAALTSLQLQKPGEGYAFLDEVPRPDESRIDNCHFAADVALGDECGIGYRYVATLTMAPLVVGRGNQSEIDAAMAHSKSVAWPLLRGRDEVRRLARSDIESWCKSARISR